MRALAVGSQNVFAHACLALPTLPAGPIIVRRPGLHRKKSQLGFAKAADRDAAAVAAAAAAVLAVAPPETWLIPAVLDRMRANAAAQQQAQEAVSCPASPAARPTPDLEGSAAFAAAVDAAAAKLRLSLDLELSPDEVHGGVYCVGAVWQRPARWIMELYAVVKAPSTACPAPPPTAPQPTAPLTLSHRSPRSFPAGAVAGAGTRTTRVARARPLSSSSARAARRRRLSQRQPARPSCPFCHHHQAPNHLPTGFPAQRPAPAGERAAPPAGCHRLHGTPRHALSVARAHAPAECIQRRTHRMTAAHVHTLCDNWPGTKGASMTPMKL